jgi:hypothetical protein
MFPKLAAMFSASCKALPTNGLARSVAIEGRLEFRSQPHVAGGQAQVYPALWQFGELARVASCVSCCESGDAAHREQHPRLLCPWTKERYS